jgi:hypothetical protein
MQIVNDKMKAGRNGVSSTLPTLTLSTCLEVNMAKDQPTLFPIQPTKSDGRIQKGQRLSPATEFKKGQHWRPRKPHWDREWMVQEYVLNGRSTGDIAVEIGTTDSNVLYWLHKHDIPRRDVSKARQLKHWGAAGKANPMYGKRGAEVPNWKGGVTADRQAFYASQEWKTACSSVWKRDKAICQRCSKSARAIKLHVHHIVSFQTVDLRAEISNLVLLCFSCHRWVHSKKNTDGLFVKNGNQ